MPEIIYEGPDGFRGWKTYLPKFEGWRYANHKFLTRSATWIGRDVDLAPKSGVAFTYCFSEPDATDPVFVGLYSSIPPGVNYYSLAIFRGSLLLTRIDADGHESNFAEIPNPYVPAHPDVRVSIYADKIARDFWLYFDGRQAAYWHDPKAFDGSGRSIYFQTFDRTAPKHLGRTGDFEISRIQVRTWNGQLPL